MTAGDAAARPRLPYTVVDGGRGPFLFMLHGMLSGAGQWLPNLERLGAFVRPVLFDLWGHGDAPCPLDDACYEVGYLVDQFEQARAELGADRVLLCGHSFGACLTLRYSVEHPERVIAQVFTNSMSALSPPELFGTPEQRRERALVVEAEGQAALRRLPFHPRNAQRLPPAVKDALVAQADATDPRAFVRLTRVTGPELSMRARLGRIACPTLLVNGRWEKSFQPLRDYAAASIPGCRVADVDAGHAVNLENPAAFDDAVTGFFSSIGLAGESA